MNLSFTCGLLAGSKLVIFCVGINSGYEYNFAKLHCVYSSQFENLPHDNVVLYSVYIGERIRECDGVVCLGMAKEILNLPY